MLRGDKSRFQLFGDTVNTAARVESAGERNRIHISQEVATLLEKANKGHWVKPRTSRVLAKGKGEMKTYWLIDPSKKSSKDGATGGDYESDYFGGSKVMTIPSTVEHSTTDGPQLSSKVQRLVDWNVDLLQRNLKAIVARRNARKSVFGINSHKNQKNQIAQMERTIGKSNNGKIVLDEVTEIVQLPHFDAVVTRNQMDPCKVQLPANVKSQLRDYVETVAKMYNPNAFHNFEHASHVTMSVSKLLSRIVAPDIDSDTGNVDLNLHDHTYGITSDPLTQFAVMLSALIHDVDHVGIPNNLLLEEDKHLAEKYKGKSMAEQNSIDLAWDVLMQERFSALRFALYGDDENDFRRFRQLLVNTVLATDIADKDLKNLRNMRWEKAFSEDYCESAEDHINRKATIVIEHLIQVSKYVSRSSCLVSSPVCCGWFVWSDR